MVTYGLFYFGFFYYKDARIATFSPEDQERYRKYLRSNGYDLLAILKGLEGEAKVSNCYLAYDYIGFTSY